MIGSGSPGRSLYRIYASWTTFELVIRTYNSLVSGKVPFFYFSLLTFLCFRLQYVIYLFRSGIILFISFLPVFRFSVFNFYICVIFFIRFLSSHDSNPVIHIVIDLSIQVCVTMRGSVGWVKGLYPSPRLQSFCSINYYYIYNIHLEF